MDASAILSLIDQIADEGNRGEKQRLLGMLVADPLGEFVVKQAYNPFITYGLTPGRTEGAGKTQMTTGNISKLLDQLARRELTGNAAAREVADVMTFLTKDSAELLWRVLSKDLKCGIAESTINLVSPGLVPVFSVMRAHKFEEKRIKKWSQIVEPKLDGFRVTFLCRDGHGGFFTRSGKRMPSLDHLVEDVIRTAEGIIVNDKANKLLRDILMDDIDSPLSDEEKAMRPTSARSSLNFMLDGEALTDGSFNDTSGALRRESTEADATYHIFDIASYAEFDAVGSIERSYMDRRALVEQFVRYSLSKALTKTPRYYAHSVEEIHDLYDQFRTAGLEGAMVKNPDGFYDKKKSYGWLKLKAEETEDLHIVGFYNGEANTKYENLMGGVIVRRYHGVGLYTDVRVGGGWSDEQRHALWEDWKHDADLFGVNAMVGYKPGWSYDPETKLPDDLKLIGRMIEIQYQEITPEQSLRHPRFIRFRDDKAGEVESKEAV